jgi:hypothetical protein
MARISEFHVTSHPRRRWLQFRLGTMLAFVAAVAIVLSWLAYDRNWIRQRHELTDNLTMRHASVFGCHSPGTDAQRLIGV